jgi:hypothetical protein
MRAIITWGVWFSIYFARFSIFLVIIDHFQYRYLALNSGMQLVGIFTTIQVVNYYGRVNLQFTLFLSASILMIMFGILYTYNGNAAIAMLFTASTCMASGISIIWCYTIELYPTEVSK